MKLINANALEKAIYEWMPKDQEIWMNSDIPPIENLVTSIMMTIQEQSPIEAIPVEWIEDWLSDHSILWDTPSEIHIRQILMDWKAEQEKRNEQ